MIPLTLQIAAVKRELGMRRGVYPKWVAAGKMTPLRAEAEIAAMEAVYLTLQTLVVEPYTPHPPLLL